MALPISDDVKTLLKVYEQAEARRVKTEVVASMAALIAGVATRDDRDAVAARLIRRHERNRHAPGRPLDLREPLREALVRPYLADRIDEPRIILELLSLQDRKRDELLAPYEEFDPVRASPVTGALKYALTVSRDPRIWERLVSHLESGVYYGLHHMDAGHGPVDGLTEGYVWDLAEAIFLMTIAPQGSIPAHIVDDLQEHWQLLRDWCVFRELALAADEFPEWTRARGSTHWVARGPIPRRYHYGQPPATHA